MALVTQGIVILSFGNKDTERIWNGEWVKKIPNEIREVGRRKLRMLNNSQSLNDLIVPPSNKLEKLSGKLKNYYSIRVNDQWRIIFKWSNGNASEVEKIDSLKPEIMKRIRNIHPGEVLLEEFLTSMNITAYRLAKDIYLPQTRVAAIVKGDRRINADTALRLSIYFGVSPKFWLGLQDDYDVEEERRVKEKELMRKKKYAVGVKIIIGVY